MNYLLDTGILLIYLRDPLTRDFIERTYNPFGVENNPILSVVSIGEIKSIALRNKWGKAKTNQLIEMLDELIIADINSEDVIEKYAEIDTFSQNKLTSKPLRMSARNMGKNDLWIAATAEVTQSTLLTTDLDFEHLKQEFIQVIQINRVR